MTDIVRNYLENRFQIHAPRQTTEEFLRLFGINRVNDLPDIASFASKEQENGQDLPFIKEPDEDTETIEEPDVPKEDEVVEQVEPQPEPELQPEPQPQLQEEVQQQEDLKDLCQGHFFFSYPLTISSSSFSIISFAKFIYPTDPLDIMS